MNQLEPFLGQKPLDCKQGSSSVGARPSPAGPHRSPSPSFFLRPLCIVLGFCLTGAAGDGRAPTEEVARLWSGASVVLIRFHGGLARVNFPARYADALAE